MVLIGFKWFIDDYGQVWIFSGQFCDQIIDSPNSVNIFWRLKHAAVIIATLTLAIKLSKSLKWVSFYQIEWFTKNPYIADQLQHRDSQKLSNRMSCSSCFSWLISKSCFVSLILQKTAGCTLHIQLMTLKVINGLYLAACGIGLATVERLGRWWTTKK